MGHSLRNATTTCFLREYTEHRYEINQNHGCITTGKKVDDNKQYGEKLYRNNKN